MHIGIVNEQFSWILDISGQNLTQREAEKWDLSPAAVIGNGEPKTWCQGCRGWGASALLCTLYCTVIRVIQTILDFIYFYKIVFEVLICICYFWSFNPY